MPPPSTDGTVTTKLSTFKKVKFYKINPMTVIEDKEYDHSIHKHKLLYLYDFHPESWGSKRDMSDLLTTGYIELWEIQYLDEFNNDGEANNTDLDDDEANSSIICELRLFSSRGSHWATAKYKQLRYNGSNIKAIKHREYLYSLTRLIPQYYIVIVNQDGEDIGVGMKLNDFYDDLRLQSNLMDFVERKEKLKNFKSNFLNDSINMEGRPRNENASGESDYDINQEDIDKYDIALNNLSLDNEGSDNFDIDDEDDDMGTDDDDDGFGEFVTV